MLLGFIRSWLQLLTTVREHKVPSLPASPLGLRQILPERLLIPHRLLLRLRHWVSVQTMKRKINDASWSRLIGVITNARHGILNLLFGKY